MRPRTRNSIKRRANCVRETARTVQSIGINPHHLQSTRNQTAAVAPGRFSGTISTAAVARRFRRKRHGAAPAASNHPVSPRHKIRTVIRAAIALVVGAVCLAIVSAPPMLAQSGNGPLAPPKRPEIVRIPNNPAPEKPPVPADEIIRRVSANQDEAAQARDAYVANKAVRLQENGSDGKPTGQVEETVEYAPADDGTLRPKASRKPEDSGLHYVDLEPDVVQALSSIPQFPFTAAQISKYVITYQTSEMVDDLTTYVFQVTPKQVEREHAYFSGLIWVDDHDLAIVKTYGKWVSELGDMKPPNLPFTMYETYFQPVANKYWMPAYARSDADVKVKDGSIPVRLIIRWDNYKPVPKQPAPPASAAH